MYLFEYLLSLSDESVGEIKTSLDAVSLLSMMIDQYKLKTRLNHQKLIRFKKVKMKSNTIRHIKWSSRQKMIEPGACNANDCNSNHKMDTDPHIGSAIIMNEHATLLQTRLQRKAKQEKYFKLRESSTRNATNLTQKPPITDKHEFLDFFDTYYSK
eukprot:139856_1